MKKLKGLYMTAFVIAVFAAALIWRLPVSAAEKEQQSREEPVYQSPPEVGKPGDGGYIRFDTEPEFDLKDVTIQVNRITEGEEFSRLTKDMEGTACIFEYKLLKDGQELHLNTGLRVGIELPDTLIGYYAKAYRIEEDGQLTELKWDNMYFEGYISVGYDFWQCLSIKDTTIGRYLVVTPHAFGDVDGDGEIGANDALKVLEMVVGLRDCGAQNTKITADVTGDGIVNAEDALEILKYTVKLRRHFCAENKIPI